MKEDTDKKDTVEVVDVVGAPVESVEVPVEVPVDAPTADQQELEDDTRRAGIKETVADSEGMAIEKDKESKGEALPSFFVDTTERRKIEIDILSGKEDGKVVSVSRTGLGLNFDDFQYLRHSREVFEFTVPSYEDLSTYRQRCGVYRKEAGQILVDRLQLRNFMLVWHLKDWSLKDKKGEKVTIAHDDDGSLSSESLKKVYSVQATILDVVLTIFEKDVLIT